MTCSQCGAEAPANAAFCPKCGVQLGRAAAGGVPPAPAARMQANVAQGAARDVPEEEVWSGSYSPKAMTGWYILIGIVAIVAIILTYNIDPNAWIAVAVTAAIIFVGLGLYSA